MWEVYGPILERLGHRVQLLDIWDSADRERALTGEFDAFVWWAKHTPAIKRLARRLIYYFSQERRMPTFPSWRAYWHYDDKVAQYLLFRQRGIATPRTFIFFNRKDALGFVRRTELPIVYKCAHGAGSSNVGILTNRASAMRYVRRAFGRGVRTFFAGERQRGYVLLQEFLPGNSGDYRLVCYGDTLVCGFFRHNRPNAPLASGSGEFSTPQLPPGLLDFVVDAQRKLGYGVMSYDVLRERSGGWALTEMSVLFGDLRQTVYDTALVYQRDEASGQWVYQGATDDRHERLLRSVLAEWGFACG